jgi:hypothetical protein
VKTPRAREKAKGSESWNRGQKGRNVNWLLLKAVSKEITMKHGCRGANYGIKQGSVEVIARITD